MSTRVFAAYLNSIGVKAQQVCLLLLLLQDTWLNIFLWLLLICFELFPMYIVKMDDHNTSFGMLYSLILSSPLMLFREYCSMMHLTLDFSQRMISQVQTFWRQPILLLPLNYTMTGFAIKQFPQLLASSERLLLKAADSENSTL